MPSDGEKQTVVVTFHKASDCFWVLCFVIDTARYDILYPQVCLYAKSVKCS